MYRLFDHVTIAVNQGISRYRPLSDRRLNDGQAVASTAIVPAQPLVTVLSTTNSNVGIAAPYYSGYYNNGGSGSGLGRRVSTLEEIVGKINSKHEADEARERARKEEEDQKKKEQDEEQRRMREKKDREELQGQMHKEMTAKLDVVREAIDGKKTGDAEELEKLKAQVELLCRQQSNVETGGKNAGEESEVVRLRAQVKALKQAQEVASTSATVTRAASEAEEMVRMRREQVEAKTAMEKRLVAMEEVIFALQKQCEVAEANAEVWRIEAMRSGNKQGSVVVGQTPVTDARSEEEVEKLQEAMARLEIGKKMGGTNLKSKMDDAAVMSTRKDKGKEGETLIILVSQREAFLRDVRKHLRNLEKDEIQGICEKEGIVNTKLDETKEAIAQARTDRAMKDDDRGKGKEQDDYVVELTDNREGESGKSDEHDSATS
ncbi:hypothetical protein CBR_g36294 [Chara braunii]|uniref:Uncharacterized protein n=1 Tax=Chara braunii TaxID=69332 RepID=A0A388LKB4_CHABU|nr:hypothetical protein CBR_g36294 [Chara braunii]|eukprot:GBG82764.1 hypothetical protein CBR_g36294 [Chara braunii]